MISRVIKCWIWLANDLLVLSMKRWMHSRHTHIHICRHTETDRHHFHSSCLIKRFVCERARWVEHSVIAMCVFFNKLFLSLLNILWPYRGQYILVASFVLCQHDQGKHPLGLSLSFFISLSSSFHPRFFTLSPAFSSSFTLSPSWFCLSFPSQRWKPPHGSFHSSWSGPNEVAYLMNPSPPHSLFR